MRVVLIFSQIPKRELTVVDDTEFSVRVTLWGKQAEQFNVTDQPVIAFKGAKVGDFQGSFLLPLAESLVTSESQQAVLCLS